MGDPGSFLLDGSEASVKTVSGAVSANEQSNFKVHFNKHKRLEGLTPTSRRCAGACRTHVSAERNTTIFGFHSVSPSEAVALLPARWPDFPVDYASVFFPLPCSFPVRVSSTPDVSGRTASGGDQQTE
jgi:hypothetical protein